MTQNETILHPATSKSSSLRTTVPMFIINQFKLKQGDKLRWNLEAKEGKIVIVLEPVK